jgi:hypothetical protein
MIKAQLDKVEGDVIFYEDLALPFSSFHKLSAMINYEEEMATQGIDLLTIRNYYEQKKTSTTVYT